MLQLALAAVAFVAGFLDAIAGGGGLLTVPALLLATGSAHGALATNKGQAVFGSASALVSFARAGQVDRRRALPTFFAAFAGSLLGVRLVLALDPTVLRPVVVALLVVVGVSFALNHRRSGAGRRGLPLAERHPLAAAVAIGVCLGAYDGFFGPGVGTFLIAAYVHVFGDELTAATANAKVANFASNLGSLLTFAAAGAIDWHLALPMAGAQAAGAALGARAALRGRERVIRAAVLLVAFALSARLVWQMVSG